MASVFQQQVTQAENTKRSAEGARAEAQQARSGISTPSADNLISEGDAQLAAGNALLARGHPAEAIIEYAAAAGSFNSATADAERERAALAADAAARLEAQQAAAAAAQQAQIAAQRQRAAEAQAAAAQAQAAANAAAQSAAAKQAAEQAAALKQAQAAAAVQAALNAKAAAAAANTAALKTIAAQPQQPAAQPVPIGKPTPEPQSSKPTPAPTGSPKPVKQPQAGAGSSGTAPTAGAAIFLPVYGEQLSSAKVAIVQQIISEGRRVGASALVIKAALYAAAGESFYTPGDGGSNVFQTTCTGGAAHYGQDLQLQAHDFFLGGYCFGRGAVSYSSEYSTIWQIANATEENAVWGNSGGDSYTYPGRPSSNRTTAQLEQEITNLYDHYAGVGAPAPSTSQHGHPPSNGPGSGPQTPTPSAPVSSRAWNGNTEGMQLQAGYQQLHDTLSKWNPGSRHQLQLIAHRPIGG